MTFWNKAIPKTEKKKRSNLTAGGTDDKWTWRRQLRKFREQPAAEVWWTTSCDCSINLVQIPGSQIETPATFDNILLRFLLQAGATLFENALVAGMIRAWLPEVGGNFWFLKMLLGPKKWSIRYLFDLRGMFIWHLQMVDFNLRTVFFSIIGAVPNISWENHEERMPFGWRKSSHNVVLEKATPGGCHYRPRSSGPAGKTFLNWGRIAFLARFFFLPNCWTFFLSWKAGWISPLETGNQWPNFCFLTALFVIPVNSPTCESLMFTAQSCHGVDFQRYKETSLLPGYQLVHEFWISTQQEDPQNSQRSHDAISIDRYKSTIVQFWIIHIWHGWVRESILMMRINHSNDTQQCYEPVCS